MLECRGVLSLSLSEFDRLIAFESKQRFFTFFLYPVFDIALFRGESKFEECTLSVKLTFCGWGVTALMRRNVYIYSDFFKIENHTILNLGFDA